MTTRNDDTAETARRYVQQLIGPRKVRLEDLTFDGHDSSLDVLDEYPELSVRDDEPGSLFDHVD